MVTFTEGSMWPSAEVSCLIQDVKRISISGVVMQMQEGGNSQNKEGAFWATNESNHEIKTRKQLFVVRILRA